MISELVAVKKMKLIIFIGLAAVVTAFEFPEAWKAWKAEHGKKYHSAKEELHRHIVWQSNHKYVDEHNSHADKFGYTLKMNKFGDLENSEFVAMYNGYRKSGAKRSGKPFIPTVDVGDLPTTVDWREKGFVTPVKDQGQCGSCWAFSTTGSLEGQHFNATKQLVSLSEQNLVDCSDDFGNQGCDGGLPDNAFKYVMKSGIDTEDSYPYLAHDEPCQFKPANVGAHISNYVDVQEKNETALQVASATVGPISVAIDASHQDFQLYSTGVYNPPACSSTRLDHAVLVVGYGTDASSGQEYWLVKNSWGVSWGMEGYIQMIRNKRNKCGIATAASYPVV